MANPAWFQDSDLILQLSNLNGVLNDPNLLLSQKKELDLS